MARPVKRGVDYFPLDTKMNDKMRFIEMKFGLKGFAVIVKLWMKIYSVGYYSEWNEDVALMFADDNRVGVNVVSEILSEALRRGIFSQKLYDEYEILTSEGLQKRYLEITSRRSKVELIKEYLLINIPTEAVNVYINSINDDINSIKTHRNTQSKVNKSKVNKSKVNKSTPAAKKSYGEYKNVLLTDDDLEKLKAEYPQNWQEWIERLSSYMASKGVAYKNHLATIRNWARKEPKQNAQIVKKSKFNNFENTNKTDYAALEEKLLDMMLEG